MANVSAEYNATPQRINTATDVYYTLVDSGESVYKGSLLVVLSGADGISYGQNAASAVFKGVAATTVLSADGTDDRVGHYVNGVYTMKVSGSTVNLDDEVYIGSDPNTVQKDTSTGPKCGRCVRYISATECKISIDGYAD